MISKNQKYFIVFAAFLASTNIFIFLSNVIQDSFWNTVIISILNVGIIFLVGWCFKISPQTATTLFQYFLTALPAIIALTIIGMIRLLLEIPELAATNYGKDLALFEVGLWFVILPTIAAIYVLRVSDVRLKKLEGIVFPKKDLITTTNDKPKKTKLNLEKISHVATISGVGIALVFGIPTLWSIQSDIDATQKQLAQTDITISKLSNLVENSNKQLESLNKTVSEIHHQTLVQAYMDGGSFSLDVYRCSKPYSENNKTQMFFQPVIRDREGDPSPVPFYVYFYFDTYGIIDEQSYHHGFEARRIDMYLLDPPKRESVYLDLTNALANAEEKGIDRVQIELFTHSFAPYSPVKGQLIRDYEHVNEGRLFADLIFIDGLWDFKDPQDSICFNAMRR